MVAMEGVAEPSTTRARFPCVARQLGDLPGVIPGGVISDLYVCSVLLVKNQQAQLLQRGKDRGAGPQNDAGLARPDALPLGKAIRDPQAAVQHGDGIAKVGREKPRQQLRCAPARSGTRTRALRPSARQRWMSCR